MQKDTGHLLFEADYLEAFEQGAAVWLVRRRNRNLGNLLLSEHRDFYIQILYRMLYFRREHELEPLNEDIYAAVKAAIGQVALLEYTDTLFNRHMNQLTEWELVTCRLEKERLRGYRDERRDRFRYRLADETVSFLYWLEERLRAADEERIEDAGDLLDFVVSRLRELRRTIGRLAVGDDDEDANRKASSVVFLLHNANEYTERISRRLSETSEKMECFLLRSYNIDEAQAVVEELRVYLSGYLKRIHALRRQILAELDKLRDSEALRDCFQRHAREVRKMPRFMRGPGLIETPDKIIANLHGYYCQQGKIDTLCGRVNTTAMKVWGKLSAHLRELERRNHRRAEIDRRIVELSRLPANAVPVEFMRRLIASAAMLGDPNHWDEFTKAHPPQPRFSAAQVKRASRAYLPPPRAGTQPTVVSLEEARLRQLREWIERKFTCAELGKGVALDRLNCDQPDDFPNIVKVGKKGLLGQGKALRKINFRLDVGAKLVAVKNRQRELAFRHQTLQEITEDES